MISAFNWDLSSEACWQLLKLSSLKLNDLSRVADGEWPTPVPHPDTNIGPNLYFGSHQIESARQWSGGLQSIKLFQFAWSKVAVQHLEHLAMQQCTNSVMVQSTLPWCVTLCRRVLHMPLSCLLATSLRALLSVPSVCRLCVSLKLTWCNIRKNIKMNK